MSYVQNKIITKTFEIGFMWNKIYRRLTEILRGIDKSHVMQ
jgi:hypothetical protein